MKVYLYYLTNQIALRKLNYYGLLDSFGPEYNNGKPYLYAFTKDEKIKNFFEKIRNPNSFIRKEINIDDEEYDSLSDTYGNSLKIIRYPIIYNRDNSSVYLPLTRSEIWYVANSTRETSACICSKFTKIPINIFKNKIVDLLDDFCYVEEVFGIPTDYETDVKSYINKYGWKNSLGLFFYLYDDLIIKEKIFDLMKKDKKI